LLAEGIYRLRWDDVHAGASLTRDDAPRIDERAATSGRSATEGGDERAGVTRRYPFEGQPMSRIASYVPNRNARG